MRDRVGRAVLFIWQLFIDSTEYYETKVKYRLSSACNFVLAYSPACHLPIASRGCSLRFSGYIPEPVFINDLAQGKRLVQNLFFCKSTFRSVFSYFYNCFSQRMSVFGRFLKKDRFFWKRTDSFKE